VSGGEHHFVAFLKCLAAPVSVGILCLSILGCKYGVFGPLDVGTPLSEEIFSGGDLAGVLWLREEGTGGQGFLTAIEVEGGETCRCLN